MFHGFANALAAIGLVLVSFSVQIGGTPVITSPPNQSVSPPEDPLQSGTFGNCSAVNDNNDDTIWHCGASPKLIETELDDENVGSSPEWNYYDIIDPNRKWDHTNLTYSVIDYRNFEKKHFDWVLERAFKYWSDAAPQLTFTQLEDGDQTADIKFRIVGAFRQTAVMPAAKSFKPYWKKHVVRILGEHCWTVDSADGANLLMLVTHEIGHTLGVKHSTNEKAIMYRRIWYTNVKSFSLHKDDKAAIRKLYGGDKSDPDASSAEYENNGDASETSSVESV